MKNWFWFFTTLSSIHHAQLTAQGELMLVPKATEETDFDRTSDDESDNSSLMSDESSNVRERRNSILSVTSFISFIYKYHLVRLLITLFTDCLVITHLLTKMLLSNYQQNGYGDDSDNYSTSTGDTMSNSEYERLQAEQMQDAKDKGIFVCLFIIRTCGTVKSPSFSVRANRSDSIYLWAIELALSLNFHFYITMMNQTELRLLYWISPGIFKPLYIHVLELKCLQSCILQSGLTVYSMKAVMKWYTLLVRLDNRQK